MRISLRKNYPEILAHFANKFEKLLELYEEACANGDQHSVLCDATDPGVAVAGIPECLWFFAKDFFGAHFEIEYPRLCHALDLKKPKFTYLNSACSSEELTALILLVKFEKPLEMPELKEEKRLASVAATKVSDLSDQGSFKSSSVALMQELKRLPVTSEQNQSVGATS